MVETDRISERQLGAMAFVSLLSPMIRLLPSASVILGGRAAWLSPIVALVVTVLYLMLIRTMVKKRLDNEGMGEISKRCIGKVGGSIFCVICAVWFTFYAGFEVRTAAERLLSTVYEGAHPLSFIIVMVGASLLAARGFTKNLARTAEVFVLIIVLVLSVALIFSIPQIKTEFLFPITYMDTGSIFLGAIPIINISGAYFYFTFLLGHVEKKPGEGKKIILWSVAKMILVMAITVCTIGSLSAELTLKQQNSFFIVIRNVTILELIERIEALIICVWVIMDFIFLAALFMMTAEAWKSVTGVKNRNVFIYPTAVISAVVALFFVSNVFTLRLWSEVVVPLINLTLSFIVAPIICIIGKIRKKI